jgi:hypothetical protein
MLIHIPVSAGELIDKITILRIKAERIEPKKRSNVVHELTQLEAVAAKALPRSEQLAALTIALAEVNGKLWDIEEAKRCCERMAAFGPVFLELARAVYLENDRRAAIKRRINLLMGSEIVEEKSHGCCG